ncbi:TadE/TadG family type IV pilus assembly protein [Propionicimonas sp.]|uniref:TadE/TadG family type IV pilus assembly protein n=1 Tax=Propionicimonas sp. TaxID=1955623 RepID=UPI0039E60A27
MTARPAADPAPTRTGAFAGNRGRRGERGAAAVEFAMIVPVVVLLFSVVVGGARVWLARGVVEQAAAAAARGVSQARTPAEARQVARDLASAQAEVDGLWCDRLLVESDATALAAAPGRPGAVSTTVTCTVPLADVLVPGWPGSIQVRATSTSIVDRYRGRQ